jgi:RNA polymerase sigma-70 factor, ECF subfamily
MSSPERASPPPEACTPASVRHDRSQRGKRLRLPTTRRRADARQRLPEVKMTPRTPHANDIHGERRRGLATDDRKLVALAVARTKEGDSGALHILYVCYAKDVYRYVKTIVRDHHEAEDITQSLFVKLMSAIQSYRPRSVPFEAWLLRVARNAALDTLRTKRAVPSDDIQTSDEGHDQIAFERCLCLKEALGQLPYEEREVLVLRYIAGLPTREIADRLHRTERSIYGLHHRGRRALKAALEELDAVPLTA